MAAPGLCQPVVMFLGLTGCRFSEMATLSGPLLGHADERAVA